MKRDRLHTHEDVPFRRDWHDGERRGRRHHPEGREGHPEGRRHGGGGRGGGGRGRSRAQRGDVRAATLVLLAEQPMHGYQLMQAISDRTEGAWRPSPGAIYPTIAQLEDEGLVSVIADAGRKLVTLTEAGREHVAAIATTMSDPFAAFAAQSGGRGDLRGSVEQVHIAARTVGKTGTDDQIAAAQKILDDARRSLYLILAEGSSHGSAHPADPSAT